MGVIVTVLWVSDTGASASVCECVVRVSVAWLSELQWFSYVLVRVCELHMYKSAVLVWVSDVYMVWVSDGVSVCWCEWVMVWVCVGVSVCWCEWVMVWMSDVWWCEWVLDCWWIENVWNYLWQKHYDCIVYSKIEKTKMNIISTGNTISEQWGSDVIHFTGKTYSTSPAAECGLAPTIIMFLSCSFIHSLSPTVTLTHTITHHSFTPSLTHTNTHSHQHTLTPSLTHTNTHSHHHSLTPSHITHSHYHSLTPSLTRTITITHSYQHC